MSDWQKKQAAQVEGGKKLRNVLSKLIPEVKEGVSTLSLDTKARALIEKEGAEVSFEKVPGYRWATCMSVNEVVVHGIPSSYLLQNGDVLKLDIGIYYKGYHVDYSDTLVVGGNDATDEKTRMFLKKGRETLQGALKLVKPGNTVGMVSTYIDTHIHAAGYKVIHELTGHAVGEELHMDPLIPGIEMHNRYMQVSFKPGIAYAVEVIYSMNDAHITDANDDGWSLRTVQRSQSGCFENSVFVTQTEGIVLV